MLSNEFSDLVTSGNNFGSYQIDPAKIVFPSPLKTLCCELFTSSFEGRRSGTHLDPRGWYPGPGFHDQDIDGTLNFRLVCCLESCFRGSPEGNLLSVGRLFSTDESE